MIVRRMLMGCLLLVLSLNYFTADALGRCCYGSTDWPQCADVSFDSCAALQGWYVPEQPCPLQCSPLTSCPDSGVFSQLPTPNTGNWTVWHSDAATEWRVMDRFDGVLRPFTQLRFWGFQARWADTHFEDCFVSHWFEVQFYADSAGYPGHPLWQYTVSSQSRYSDYIYDDWGYRNTIYQFDAPLPEPVSLSSGWISIRGVNNNSGCHFVWMSSPQGDGQAWAYSDYFNGLSDRAFCLAGNSCPSPSQLTAKLENGHIQLSFNAPNRGRYKVWRTTDPNNDGNPDNGADPDWTYVGSIWVSPAGLGRWANPLLPVAYENYVVQQDCDYPPNDFCANATPVCEGEWQFTTLRSLPDGPDHQGQPCGTSPNVWYIYRPSADGVATITTCGSGYDTQIQVYNGDMGCPAPGTNALQCNDNAMCDGVPSSASTVQIPVEYTHGYLIRVGGAGGTAGDGVLRIALN